MKKIKYLSIALMAICLASCGGKKDSDNPNSVTLEVESDLGALSNYVSVSESEITLKLVEDIIKGSVGFNVTKAYEGEYSWDLEFEVEVLDESHICIAELGNTEFDHPVAKNIVNVGSKRTTIEESAGDLWEKIKNEGKYLSIKFDRSDDEIKPYSGSSSDKEVNEATETSEETSSFELSNVLLPSQLKGKVEIISAEKSVGRYGYPSMEITFKLLSTVNTSSMCSEYGQMWIIGVGQTENGVDVKELLPNYREWRSGDSDGKEFKEFLESEPGETLTLEFTGDKESSNDVESDLEKVKKFKLKITN